jgi:hypothetical protein
MKCLAACLLISAAVVATPWQEPAGGEIPPDLIIVKQTWGKETTLRDWDSSPYPAAPRGRRARPGRVGQRPHDPDSLSNRPWPVPGPESYVYKARVKNTGNREILAVRWDYVFTDAGTREVVGRHQFHSTNKIRPGKEVSLAGASASPPAKVVSAEALSRDAQAPFTGRVIVMCIIYSDGTLWRRPSFTGDCRPRE